MESQTGHQIKVWSAKPVKRYTIGTKWREEKFGKGQRPKEKWTTVDTTKHSKLQSPARWEIPDVPTFPRIGSASWTIQRNARSAKVIRF